MYAYLIESEVSLKRGSRRIILVAPGRGEIGLSRSITGRKDAMNDSRPQPMRLLRLLWIAFLFSTVVWGVLAWIVTRGAGAGAKAALSFSDPLFAALCLVAVALFVVAAQLGRFFPIRSAGDQSRISLHRFQIPLVRFALFEAIGLLGFVGAFVKLRFEACLPFLLLAVAGLLMSRPRGGA